MGFFPAAVEGFGRDLFLYIHIFFRKKSLR